MLVAGVDSSTQSCKVVVVDAATGVVVRTGRAPHPAGTEADPEAWWVALRQAIEKVGGLDDVSAISIGGQQHGLIALDAAGRVVRPALLWNDMRSADAARDLVSEIGAESFAERVGVVPVSSITIAKLRWLATEEPEVARDVCAVALPHDWLTWRLRGYGPANPDLSALTTDRSDASGTGYWGNEVYETSLLVAAFGRQLILPSVAATNTPTGETPSGVLVGPGAGDNAAVALGLGIELGDIVVSVGTSGTVFARSSHAVRDPSGTVTSFASASGDHLPLIATVNAAKVFDTTATVLGVDHRRLAELALESPPGAQGLVMVPWFDGERTPNVPTAQASMYGITHLSLTPPNLARAAIEGVMCGLASGVDALREQGLPAHRILLVGGAAENTAVATIAGQVFDVPVEVPCGAEYAALGMARQAAWVLTGALPEWELQFMPIHSESVPAIRRAFVRRATIAATL